MITVYLVGPISGLTFEEANEWRNLVESKLNFTNINVINPLKGKEYLFKDKQKEVCEPGKHEVSLFTSNAIFFKDMHSVKESDILLMNLKGSNNWSFGSPFEWGIGYMLGKTLVVVTDEKIAEHPFIKCTSVVYDNLDSAIQFIKILANESKEE